MEQKKNVSEGNNKTFFLSVKQTSFHQDVSCLINGPEANLSGLERKRVRFFFIIGEKHFSHFSFAQSFNSSSSLDLGLTTTNKIYIIPMMILGAQEK